MKDIHGERIAPGRIPVLSPALNCVAMTALVYLRSSFGYTLFQPRPLFFAFSFAVVVFEYIAWHEPELWREYRAAWLFSGGAVFLYWLHFAVTFFREFGRDADRERNDYSGSSHLLKLLKSLGFSAVATETKVQLWLEPGAVLLFAAVLRLVFSEVHLSEWLVIVAGCMFAKEWLNYWAKVQRENMGGDIEVEARERGETLGSPTAAEAPQATRVAAQNMPRKVVLTEEEERALRFAEILGITVPYDLDEAEANFRDRIQLTHPNTHGASPQNHERSLELNEAVEFFRKKLGG